MALLTQRHRQILANHVQRTEIVRRAQDLVDRHQVLMVVAPIHSGKTGLVLQLLETWESTRKIPRAIFVQLTEANADQELASLAARVSEGLPVRTVVIIEVALLSLSAHIQAELMDLVEEMMSQNLMVICTFVPRCYHQMASDLPYPVLTAQDLLMTNDELTLVHRRHVHSVTRPLKRVIGIATAEPKLAPSVLFAQVEESRQDMEAHGRWRLFFEDMVVLGQGSTALYGHQQQGDLQRCYSYLAKYYPALGVNDYDMTFNFPQMDDAREQVMLSKIYEHRPDEVAALLQFMIDCAQQGRACKVARTVMSARHAYDFICRHSYALAFSGALFDEQLHPERYARGEHTCSALYGPAYDLPHVVTNIDDEEMLTTNRFARMSSGDQDELLYEERGQRRPEQPLFFSDGQQNNPSIQRLAKTVQTSLDAQVEQGQIPNEEPSTGITQGLLLTTSSRIERHESFADSEGIQRCQFGHQKVERHPCRCLLGATMGELTQRSRHRIGALMDQVETGACPNRSWLTLLGEAWAHVAYAWMLGEGYVLDACLRRGIGLIEQMRTAYAELTEHATLAEKQTAHMDKEIAAGAQPNTEGAQPNTEGVQLGAADAYAPKVHKDLPYRLSKEHHELIEALEIAASMRLQSQQIRDLSPDPTSPGVVILRAAMHRYSEHQHACAHWSSLCVTPAHQRLSDLMRSVLEHVTVVASALEGEVDMMASHLIPGTDRPQTVLQALTCANAALLSCMLCREHQRVTVWFNHALTFFEAHHLRWVGATYQLCMQIWYALTTNRPGSTRLRERVQAYGLRLHAPLLTFLSALDETVSLVQAGHRARADLAAQRLMTQAQEVPSLLIQRIAAVVCAACQTHRKPSLFSQERYAEAVQAQTGAHTRYNVVPKENEVISFTRTSPSLLEILKATEEVCLAYAALGDEGLARVLPSLRSCLLSSIGQGILRWIAPLLHKDCRGQIDEYLAHEACVAPQMSLGVPMRFRHAQRSARVQERHGLRLVEGAGDTSALDVGTARMQKAYTPAYLDAVARWSGAQLNMPAPTQLIDVEKTPPAHRVELTLLARLQLRIDGQLVVSERGVKRRMLTLITALGIFANKDVLRDSLIDELWGHMSYKQANNNLYVSVSKLKKLLGSRLDQEPYIINSEHSIRLHIEESACDVARFNSLDAQITRQAANLTIPIDEQLQSYLALSQLYHTCVSGITFEPHGIFGQEVARLETTFIDHMVQAGYLCLSVRRPTLGLWFARRAGSYASAREDVCQLLMLTLALSGQRSEALNLYFAHLRYLNSELGVDVSSDTKALYQQILVGNLQHLQEVCLGMKQSVSQNTLATASALAHSNKEGAGASLSADMTETCAAISGLKVGRNVLDQAA